LKASKTRAKNAQSRLGFALLVLLGRRRLIVVLGWLRFGILSRPRLFRSGGLGLRLVLRRLFFSRLLESRVIDRERLDRGLLAMVRAEAPRLLPDIDDRNEVPPHIDQRDVVPPAVVLDRVLLLVVVLDN